MKTLCLIGLLLLACIPAFSVTWYVNASGGSDPASYPPTACQTIGTPCAHIGPIVNPLWYAGQPSAACHAGDTIIVHTGIYRESLYFGCGGSLGSPITVQSANDGPVVIDASTCITLPTTETHGSTQANPCSAAWTWTLDSGANYKTAALGFEVAGVSVGGVPLNPAYSMDSPIPWSAVTLGAGYYFQDLQTRILYVHLSDGSDPNGHSDLIVVPSFRNTGGYAGTGPFINAIYVDGWSYFVFDGITVRGAPNYGMFLFKDGSGGHYTVTNSVAEFNNWTGIGGDVTYPTATNNDVHYNMYNNHPFGRCSFGYIGPGTSMAAAGTVTIDATAKTVTRTAGSFVTDGVTAGNYFALGTIGGNGNNQTWFIKGTGFANAGNTESYKIAPAGVTATVLTLLDPSNHLVNETNYNPAISAISRDAGGVVTVTTSTAHHLSLKQGMTIEGVTDTSFNTVQATVTSVADSTHFTYSQSATLGAATSSGGDVAEIFYVSDNTVPYNSCWGSPSVGGWGGGLALGGGNGVITNNTVHHNGGEGIIEYGGPGSNVVHNNVSHDNYSMNFYNDSEPNDTLSYNFSYFSGYDPFDPGTTANASLLASTKGKARPICFGAAEEISHTLSNYKLVSSLGVNCRYGWIFLWESMNPTPGFQSGSVINNTFIAPAASGVTETGLPYAAIRIAQPGYNSSSVFKNNNFYSLNAANPALWDNDSPTNLTGLTFDYNNFYNSLSSNPIALTGTTLNTNCTTGTTWQTVSGGTHQTCSDPGLVNASSITPASDKALAAASGPAYHTGTYLVGFNDSFTDYAGSAFNNPPSMGAFEFGAAPPASNGSIQTSNTIRTAGTVIQ